MAEITDAMSIALQQAAKRTTSWVWPLPDGLSEDDDKIINKLLNRKLIKRVKVEAIEPHHKKVRGSGPVNYVITKTGLKEISW